MKFFLNVSAELKARPLDVGVHIRLLCLYLETGRTKAAYNHAIELESRQAFYRNLSFYECLAKVCDVSNIIILNYIVRVNVMVTVLKTPEVSVSDGVNRLV